MVMVRQVLGPFNPEENIQPYGSATMKWYFIGIRDNHEVANWILSYDVDKRKWNVANVPLGLPTGKRMKALTEKLTKEGRDPVKSIDPDMFFRGSTKLPLVGDRLIDVLRSCLSPADLAKATTYSLQRRGR
ncbi:hypothetical protein [Shinella sp. JR1-6]|uniref:hypothetical protein n=1 Tax=Shinella sp. JR1-6 TaxID=2527671 RepID=UPI00102D3D80|nr:hypothetical protein [Shinella sp. JR1-6]TAA54596.1 hypothetical protein EXZ48_26590 [Shinella sp. JR1-6]